MPNIYLSIQELRAIKKLNFEMKWRWKCLINRFYGINSFLYNMREFIYIRRELAEAEVWRSNCTDYDNLRIKNKWEKIYEFNINQFILRTGYILYGWEYGAEYALADEYYSDYYEEDSSNSGFCWGCGKGGPGDIACRCEKRRNPYFDDDNWRQREHDTEESFRLAGD